MRHHVLIPRLISEQSAYNVARFKAGTEEKRTKVQNSVKFKLNFQILSASNLPGLLF